MESRIAFVLGLLLVALSTAALLVRQPTTLEMVLAGIVASIGAALLILSALAARWRHAEVAEIRPEHVPAGRIAPHQDGETASALVG